MKRLISTAIFSILSQFFFCSNLYSQGASCATAPRLITNDAQTLANFNPMMANTGNAYCTQAPGYDNWFFIVTDSAATPIEIIVQQWSTQAFTISLYSDCGTTLIPQPDSVRCHNDGGTYAWRSPCTGLMPNTVYWFKIWVRNGFGVSIYSRKLSGSGSPTSITNSSTICSGQSTVLTANGGSTFLWSPGGETTQSITVSPNVTTSYSCIISGCSTTNLSTIVNVNQPMTPSFAPIAAICRGGSFILPNTATNGITGNWSPSINNTSTTTYTFTPDVGQCATSTTATIIVNQPVTPSFAAIAPICRGDAFILPTTSNNGIAGIWTPAINNTATTTYTFTPNSGQCATPTTATIVVNQPVIPSFAPIAAICRGGTITLPTTSNNGISGSWIPAINNTATTTYMFTPNSGQCATSTTATIVVNQPVTPSFAPITAICRGGAIALPTISTDGISGSWSPAINNTATTTYTFTPNSGQCANTSTLTVVVIQPVTPNFTQVASICNGGSFTLPTTSSNGITGSWDPAINNTTTTTYTFTPDNGQCASITTMTVAVNSKTDPEFSSVAAICNGGIVPSLPNTSNNGITGIWSPSVINNNTADTYTFTPSVNECATPKSITTVVIPNPYNNIRYSTVNAVQNQNYQLQARSFQNANYLWTPSSGLNNVSIVNPVFNYNRQQQYNIKITTSEGCVVVDTILVRMYQNCEIYVPGGFSPNGDGMNDVLFPELVGIAQLKSFKVFDRWGQMMFQTNIPGQGWDGRYKGVKQPIETYMWMSEGIDVNGNIIKKNGSTILMR